MTATITESTFFLDDASCLHMIHVRVPRVLRKGMTEKQKKNYYSIEMFVFTYDDGFVFIVKERS